MANGSHAACIVAGFGVLLGIACASRGASTPPSWNDAGTLARATGGSRDTHGDAGVLGHMQVDAAPVATSDALLAESVDASGGAVIVGRCKAGDVLPASAEAGVDYANSIYYCDAAGDWVEAYVGECNAAACTACLTARCQTTFPVDAGAACAPSFEAAVRFLSACGPDRSPLFTELVECDQTDYALGMLLEHCKDDSCVDSIGLGPCSMY